MTEGGELPLFKFFVHFCPKKRSFMDLGGQFNFMPSCPSSNVLLLFQKREILVNEKVILFFSFFWEI